MIRRQVVKNNVVMFERGPGFRYFLIRARHNAESIAFFDGDSVEYQCTHDQLL